MTCITRGQDDSSRESPKKRAFYDCPQASPTRSDSSLGDRPLADSSEEVLGTNSKARGSPPGQATRLRSFRIRSALESVTEVRDPPIGRRRAARQVHRSSAAAVPALHRRGRSSSLPAAPTAVSARPPSPVGSRGVHLDWFRPFWVSRAAPLLRDPVPTAADTAAPHLR